jgi:hypothetical protein
MASAESEEAQVRKERRALRLLYQGTSQGSLRGNAKAILRDYRWREPLHEVLFQIFMSLQTENSEIVRRELPGLLTRRGFPDASCADLFEPHDLSNERALQLLKELAQS